MGYRVGKEFPQGPPLCIVPLQRCWPRGFSGDRLGEKQGHQKRSEPGGFFLLCLPKIHRIFGGPGVCRRKSQAISTEDERFLRFRGSLRFACFFPIRSPPKMPWHFRGGQEHKWVGKNISPGARSSSFFSRSKIAFFPGKEKTCMRSHGNCLQFLRDRMQVFSFRRLPSKIASDFRRETAGPPKIS